jgi:hypothetical protein
MMPGVSKTAQAVHSTRRLEDSLHAPMMTNHHPESKGFEFPWALQAHP